MGGVAICCDFIILSVSFSSFLLRFLESPESHK